MSILENWDLRSVKMLHIFILGNIYLFLGVKTSTFLKKNVCREYDEKKSKLENLINLIRETGLIMVAAYLIRIIVKNLYSPFEGVYGFKYSRVKEASGGLIMAFAFLMILGPCIKDKAIKLYSY